MRNRLGALLTGVLLASSETAFAQQRQPQLKTIPDSINFIWKDIEKDFTALAEAMPEERWSFKPTQGEFKDVRTFGEQVKHVACANEAWAKQMVAKSRLPGATSVVLIPPRRKRKSCHISMIPSP